LIHKGSLAKCDDNNQNASNAFGGRTPPADPLGEVSAFQITCHSRSEGEKREGGKGRGRKRTGKRKEMEGGV